MPRIRPFDMQRSSDQLCSIRHAVKMATAGTGEVGEIIKSAECAVPPKEFTKMIRTCRDTQDWQKALDILDVARSEDSEEGSPLNFFTLSATISVCCKSGRVSEALSLLEEMKVRGEKDAAYRPTSAVYRLVIMSCVKGGQLGKSMSIFEEMLQRGVHPDDDTLVHVLSAMIEEQQWEMGVRTMDRVHGRGTAFTVEQYNYFISSCAVEGNLDTVTEVLIMMQMAGVEPNSLTCHHVILSAEKSGRTPTGVEFLHNVHAVGIEVHVMTLVCLLEALLDVGHLQIVPDVITLLEKKFGRGGTRPQSSIPGSV